MNRLFDPDDEPLSRAEEIAIEATASLVADALAGGGVLDLDSIEHQAIEELPAQLQIAEIVCHELLAEAAQHVRQLVDELRSQAGSVSLH